MPPVFDWWSLPTFDNQKENLLLFWQKSEDKAL